MAPNGCCQSPAIRFCIAFHHEAHVDPLACNLDRAFSALNREAKAGAE